MEIIVPKWGLTMDDATLVTWLVKVGDAVTEGQPLAEIETDKSAGEVESPAAGIISETIAGPGDTVEPGQVIGHLSIEG